jgi:hypothetical protein
LPNNLSQASIGGEKLAGAIQPGDEYWMGAVSSFWDNIATRANYDAYRTTNNNSAQYGAFTSSSRTDERCPATNGGVCRLPLFDQREQDLIHDGDPALMSADPIVGGINHTTAGCNWFWKPDDRGEQGGYSLYDATNNNQIASIPHGTTTYTELGLVNDSTTYFRYLDSILVNDTTTTIIPAPGVPPVAVTVTASDVNQNIIAHTRLHIANATNPAINEDVEVLSNPTPDSSSGKTKFVIVNTVNGYPAGAILTSEVAYSGVDALDSTSTSMANLTQPSYGTRLPGNTMGNPGNPAATIAQCKPRATPPPASNLAVAANFVLKEQPTPYPTYPGPIPTASGTSLGLITFSGSVDETAASPQVTPTMLLYNNSDGASGIGPSPLPVTWSKASCGTDCLTWSVASPFPQATTLAHTTGPGNGKFGPLDAEFTVGSGANGQGPWMNYARNNRVMDPAYRTNDAALRSTCSFQQHLDSDDLLDDLIVLPGQLNNPLGAANNWIYTEETGFNLDIKNNDIPPTVDAYILIQSQYSSCTQSSSGPALFNYFAQPHHFGSFPGIGPWIPDWGSASSTPWGINWDDALILNLGFSPPDSGTGSQPQCGTTGTGNSNCYYSNSPATIAAEAGVKSDRFFDTAFYQVSRMPNAGEWEGQVATILEDANMVVTSGPLIGQPNPIFDTAIEQISGSVAPIVYWTRGNTLLVQQYPLGVAGGANLTDVDNPYDTSLNYEPLFPVQYVPIGSPIEPLIPFPIPSPGVQNTTMLENTDLFNSTDKLFERWYTNGVIIECQDDTTPGAQPTCKHHDFPQTVYLLNVDAGTGGANTGQIIGCTMNCNRMYTAEVSTGTMTKNQVQIIVFSPQ